MALGADSVVSIYCAPGLFEYVAEVARPYVVSWLEGEDASIYALHSAVDGIGPLRLPSTQFLLVDGDCGYRVTVADTDAGGQEATMEMILDFGHKVVPIKAVIQALPSGRVHGASYEGGFHLVKDKPERMQEVRTLWIRCAASALVFSQILRRHRTRVECVSTGNAKRGTASYRGDAYVIRGFSDVLKYYRRLDRRESLATGGKQRWHMRAGHFVLLNTPREYWRNPCEAGDERLGRIVKDYSLPKYQPRERTA
jgi:hypothetical protein